MTVKIKKYIACLVLIFSVLYVTNGTSSDKTHEAFKESIIVNSEIGTGD